MGGEWTVGVPLRLMRSQWGSACKIFRHDCRQVLCPKEPLLSASVVRFREAGGERTRMWRGAIFIDGS